MPQTTRHETTRPPLRRRLQRLFSHSRMAADLARLLDDGTLGALDLDNLERMAEYWALQRRQLRRGRAAGRFHAQDASGNDVDNSTGAVLMGFGPFIDVVLVPPDDTKDAQPQQGAAIHVSRWMGVNLRPNQAALPVVALIGRDLLQKTLFIYNGHDGSFSLAL